MENGLGRVGYLMLAGVLLLLGALGLAATYLAYVESSPTFFRLGLGISAIALAGLFGFAVWAPWLGGAPRTEPPEPALPSAAPPQGPARPARNIEFEFNDAEPAANAAPDDLVLPEAFRDIRPPGAEISPGARDPTSWPQRRSRGNERNTWAAQVARRQRVEDMVEDSPVRAKMQERYTRTTPTVRGIIQEAPMHIAERAPADVGPGFAAPGMSVGQCGRCKTMVMAPHERPLRLKCPECAKVTSLD